MFKKLDIPALNLQDALDLAVLIERQAEERYLMFVDLLGQRYSGDAADFFAMMARNERRHGEQLLARRRKLFGGAPMCVTADMICDEEAEHQRLLEEQKAKYPETLEPDVDSEDVDTPAL